MASYFAYPCPDCRTTNDLHEPACRFAGTPWTEIEAAYVEVLAPLTVADRTEESVREAVPGRWSPLHAAVLSNLKRTRRIREDDTRLELLTPEEFREVAATPGFEPLQTIYEYGSVPGCHDHSVFALIAYYEMIGLSWPETRQKTVEWLETSGAWARGGFEEPSPEAVVDNKRHVYEEGYGWKQAAQEAKAVIDRAR